MHDLLKNNSTVYIGLKLKAADDTNYYPIQIHKYRPVSSLPLVFWFQITVSSIGFLLGCWIWSFRPDDMSARIFAVLNATYPVFAFSAAIYSTRDLALNGDFLKVLSVINTAGASYYGCALMSLFLIYPKPLIKSIYLIFIPVFFTFWLVLDTLYLLPAPSLGSDLPVTIQMLSAIIFALVQWYANRKNPLGRAALRWFAACILISCGLFVFLVQTVQLLGFEANVSQGYAFGFFLLVTVGIAFGLKRYRLFNLDQWAFGILFWLGGAIALVLIDALLVLVISPAISLGVAILFCGMIWLPVRGFLQRWIFQSNKLKNEALFQAILNISFTTQSEQRLDQWHTLLQQLFKPLDIQTTNQNLLKPLIALDGLELLVPAIDDIPALKIQYAQQGRRLFSKSDELMVHQLVALIERANDSRNAYDRGVVEERSRIARDLHDDIGSRLLSGLYQQDMAQTKQLIRQAIADMRTVISGLTGSGLALSTILKSLHQETIARFQDNHIWLEWTDKTEEAQAIQLNYYLYKNYVSMMREILSNLIKYANASNVKVSIRCDEHTLLTIIHDDGQGFDIEGQLSRLQPEQHGLSNLQTRMQNISGHMMIESRKGQQGTTISLSIPLVLQHEYLSS